ncbi:MAG: MarR family winged helix-turn-helix transcriptional regulator [Pseudomonadota bacterium]
MRRINADLHPQAKEFDYEGVGPIGGMMLLTIGEAEPVELQTIIAKMGRDKSQITRLIQSLERKGLLKKHRNDEDAREIVLVLTPTGRRQLESIQNALADVIEHIFEPLTHREKAQFLQIISRLNEEPGD